MTEILFYHLHRRARTRAPDALAEIDRARLAGRGAGGVGGAGRARAHGPFATSFLRGTARDAEAREQPMLTVDDDNPNGATVRFLLDGTGVPADASAYQRIVLFDGDDPTRSPRARWGGRKRVGSTLPIGSPTKTAAGSARPEAARPPGVAPGARVRCMRALRMS
jgi:DNA polymerase-3 subunit chi